MKVVLQYNNISEEIELNGSDWQTIKETAINAMYNAFPQLVNNCTIEEEDLPDDGKKLIFRKMLGQWG